MPNMKRLDVGDNLCFAPSSMYYSYQKYQKRWDAWEGKDQRRRTMPCEIRPIVAKSPQERGLAAESGDTPKAEASNVPYKNKQNTNIYCKIF